MDRSAAKRRVPSLVSSFGTGSNRLRGIEIFHKKKPTMVKKCTQPEPVKESSSKKGDLKTLCAGNPTGRDKRKCQLYSVLSKLASKGKKAPG